MERIGIDLYFQVLTRHFDIIIHQPPVKDSTNVGMRGWRWAQNPALSLVISDKLFSEPDWASASCFEV